MKAENEIEAKALPVLKWETEAPGGSGTPRISPRISECDLSWGKKVVENVISEYDMVLN